MGEQENTTGVPITEQVSQEPVSPATEPVTASEPQALSAADVQQLIKAAIAQAVEQGKQVGKRELQSAQDRNKAEAARIAARAERAEGTLRTVRERIRATDPVMAKDLELDEFRAREEARTQEEQIAAAEQARTAFLADFWESLNKHIESLGIDPNDKRIERGTEEMTPLQVQQIVLESVGKLQKENIKAKESDYEKRLKDLEAKVSGVNVEVNSVSTASSSGAPIGSDAEFLKKFGAGELLSTKANLERVRKIQSQY